MSQESGSDFIGNDPSLTGRSGDISVAQLLQHGDIEFVQLAYLALLGREVDDSGLANYLQQLRAGADKSGILVELALSLEGRSRPVKMQGLAELKEHARSRSPSPRARLLRRVVRLFHVPDESLERGWRVVDNHLHRIDAVLVRQGQEIASLRAELSKFESQARVQPSPATDPAAEVPAAPPATRFVRVAPPRAQNLLASLRYLQTFRRR